MSTSTGSVTSTPITFNGQSTFSSSFQQVLQRAVSIASLPMQQLQDDVSTLEGQQTDLSTLGASFSSLQSAVQAISSAMTGNVSASSSDSSVVTASAESTTLPGTYSIQVSQVGSSATTISGAGTPVTDPSSANISSSASFTLTVNGTPTPITPTGGTLDALADAINGANAGVSATIVNLGSNTSPDYRLSLTSTALGANTIQLSDSNSNPLLTSVQPGAPAQYTVNGNTTILSSDSDQVTLAPGLTANLVGEDPGTTVTITVAASESNLSSALSSFATAYNAAVAATAKETGQGGGALAGQSLVYELQSTLSQIAQFTSSSGSIQDLSDLGLDLDSTGNLTFNASQFDSQSAANIQQYLGGLTSGGFLETANNVLSTAADPTTGMLVTQYNNISSEITSDQSQISNDQTQVNTIQANLAQQLSAADAAIAVLQQQNTFYTNLFQTENANNIAGLG